MSRVFLEQMSKRVMTFGVVATTAMFMAACQHMDQSAKAPTASMDNEASQLAAIQEVFDASAEQVPTLTAVGYAVVPHNLAVVTRRSA